jgi:acyl-CoA dehydrogenase
MSELRDILEDTVTRLFDDFVTRETLEASETGVWPEPLWTALTESGLTRPLVAESQGGAGASWHDTFVIIKAAGRFAAPVPLPETILAGWLLGRSGMDIPDGPLTIAAGGTAPLPSLTRQKDGWRVSGALPAVPWGAAAGHVVFTANHDGETRLALAETADAACQTDRNTAREPRDRLDFDAAPVELLAPEAATGDAIGLYGAMMRAAQMAGAVERALAEGVQYANDRVQFGRPIAKFQAIQHQLATLAALSAQATLAAESAFRAADRRDPRFEIACAKVIAGEAAVAAAAIVHQVHGAIGFTYEHSLHFATRRLWSWRPEFGGESLWAEELGRMVAARGGDALWSDLTQRQSTGAPE